MVEGPMATAMKTTCRAVLATTIQLNTPRKQLKNLNLKVIALAVSLTFSAVAMAQTMTESNYKAAKEKIGVE